MSSSDRTETMSRSSVLAVVVAYNRAPLLAQVLHALQSQTADDVDVLVIDNASTDDTAQVAADAGVMLFNPGENLGGAGGFAWGVELAIRLGYDYAYLMDDDAVPHQDAIASLLKATREEPTAAFFVSVPVDPDGGHIGVAGAPIPSMSFEDQLPAVRQGRLAVTSAAFLGLLLDLSVASREALPNPAFFIWCDDVEYTTRLASKYGGYCCSSSRIVHLSPSMQSLASRRSLGWKYFYQVRNQLWLSRWGLRSAGRIARVQALATSMRAMRSEFSSQGPSIALIGTTARALKQGVCSHPLRLSPGALLASNLHARKWVEEAASAPMISGLGGRS